MIYIEKIFERNGDFGIVIEFTTRDVLDSYIIAAKLRHKNVGKGLFGHYWYPKRYRDIFEKERIIGFNAQIFYDAFCEAARKHWLYYFELERKYGKA